MQLTTTKGHCLKGLSECLKELSKDALLRFRPEGLVIKSTSPSSVCMADVQLDAKDIPLYICKQCYETGIDMHMLFRVLKNVSGEEEVTLKILRHEPDKLYIIIDNGRKQIRTTAKMKQLDLNPEYYGELSLQYNTHVRMLSAHLRDMVRDMAQVAEDMRIIADTAEDRLHFSCEGQSADLQVELLDDGGEQQGQAQERQPGSEGEQQVLAWRSKKSIDEKFSLRWLSSVCKAAQAPLGTIVELFLAPRLPMMLRFRLGDLGSIAYTLAAKMPDEELYDWHPPLKKARRPAGPVGLSAISDDEDDGGSQNSRLAGEDDECGDQYGEQYGDQYVG